ncbi:MAG: FAD-dependent oxidoreductase [Anaerolineales bacterium]
MDRTQVDRKTRVNLLPPEPRLRPAAERICDFDPTLIALTPETAQEIAACCIQCPDPAACQTACPVNNDIPRAMWLIEQGDFLGAAAVYQETSTLPSICGRVCPHDALCQGACVRNKRNEPIYTGILEAFVADYAQVHGGPSLKVGSPTGNHVAIVGSGPSGLACAAKLREAGHDVTIFDKNPAPGGLLTYGIPNFKLPASVVESRIEDFLQAGVKFELGVEIGPERTVDDLLAEGFDAVYLAIGTWVDAKFDVPGIDLPGVFQASEFLMQSKVDRDKLPLDARDMVEIGDRVVVIGGGDTASDCLRSAIRVGAEHVTCLYRRTEPQMPGNAKDRHEAMEEGAEFQYLAQPIRFLAGEDGRVAAVECLQCRLGGRDSSGRRRPIPIEGSNFIVEADTVVLALGYWPNPIIGETTRDLITRDWGLIVADQETGATSKPRVFAGGDAVTGPDLVVTAMRAGHRAAGSINEMLMS